MHTIKKRYWKQYHEKIKKIVALTAWRIPFANEYGFSGLRVLEGDGYCLQFLKTDHPLEPCKCTECPLYRRNVCSEYAHPDDESIPIFWQYYYLMLDIMKGVSDNWEKALDLAVRLKSSIELDKPS